MKENATIALAFETLCDDLTILYALADEIRDDATPEDTLHFMATDSRVNREMETLAGQLASEER